MLFWYRNESTNQWVFKDDRDGRAIMALSYELIWESRDEPNRSGLQSFLWRKGLDPLPDRAFVFEEGS
jgi:hypothetical protein